MHRCGTAGGGLGGSREEVFCGCWVVAVAALVGGSYQAAQVQACLARGGRDLCLVVACIASTVNCCA